jgi:hypothetical protein
MRGFWPMTVANVKSFYRDRASLFWTLAFPVIFVVLFGSIFSGGTSASMSGGSTRTGRRRQRSYARASRRSASSS